MNDKVKIGMMQLGSGPDKNLNLKKSLAALEDLRGKVDIAVLPEYLMGLQDGCPTPELVEKLAEPLDSPYVNAFRRKAEELGIAVLFTTYLKQKGYFNSAIFVDEKGEILGVYKKTHLFDAFGSSESKVFQRGEDIVVIDWRNYKIGLAICFDLRFPELFRVMRFSGAHMAIVASGWYEGPHKVDQWIPLIRARAHENNLFVVAVDQPSPHFIGRSMVASPYGNEVFALDGKEQVGVAEIDMKEVLETRDKVPIYNLARPSLYTKYRPYKTPP